MPSQPQAPAVSAKLDELLGYLEIDPDNLSLLGDVAETALSEGCSDVARTILQTYADRGTLPPTLQNMLGLSAMQQQDYVTAAAIFEQLIDARPEDKSVRFNLAWSLAMQQQNAAALALLDADTTRLLPQAAMLQIQMLHVTEQYEEAAELALVHIANHPDHEGLMAAISVFAIDNDDMTLARTCAAKGGNHPDALTSRGTLALSNDDAAAALQVFEAALARDAGMARAWIGKGLSELALGQTDRAAEHLQHGAQIFNDHVGSWIAAGWAQLLVNDVSAAKASFLKALAVDDAVAESHGSLAVIAMMEGRIEDAQRSVEIATRLEATCFSAALARSLLLARANDAEQARAKLQTLMSDPLDASGRTVMDTLSKWGLTR